MSLPKPTGWQQSPVIETRSKAAIAAEKTTVTMPVVTGGVKTYAVEKGLQDKINGILKSTLEMRHFSDPHVIAFINQYVVCRHAGEAARAAGMDGYSGRALLKRVDIMRAIQEISALEIEKFGYTAEDVVERQKEINDFDPIELVDENGCLITDIRMLPGPVRRAIKDMDVQVEEEKDPNGMPTGRTVIKSVKFKFHDKTKAGELLSREKGVFKEKKVVERDVGENMRNILLAQKDAAVARLTGMRNVGGDVDDE